MTTQTELTHEIDPEVLSDAAALAVGMFVPTGLDLTDVVRIMRVRVSTGELGRWCGARAYRSGANEYGVRVDRPRPVKVSGGRAVRRKGGRR